MTRLTGPGPETIVAPLGAPLKATAPLLLIDIWSYPAGKSAAPTNVKFTPSSVLKTPASLDASTPPKATVPELLITGRTAKRFVITGPPSSTSGTADPR